MRLAINKLRCGYQNNTVVEDFSAEISSGEILCLLGPNGIGKTTLFKTILGLLPALGGCVEVDGRDVRTFSIKEYARIVAYVPQAHTPPFSFRAVDVVTMGRTARLGLFGSPTEEDVRKSYQCMNELGIANLADRVYTELSGGERQMVLIARALAQEPDFLMMDEPTSNLDFGNQTQVLQTAGILAREGLGIIMTTHHPDHAFQCDARVALMLPDGEVLLGSAEEVITAETLRRAYGIDVAVLNASYQGRQLHLCQPLIEKSGTSSCP